MRFVRKAWRVIALFPCLAVAMQAQDGQQIAGYDWLLSITDTVNNLVTAKGGILLSDASMLLAAVGIIELGILIIRYLKGGDGGSVSELLGDTVMLLIGICILSAILSFWMTPFPGTTISLHQLPGSIAKQLTSTFDREMLGELQNAINAVLDPKTGIQKPSGVFDFLNVIVYSQVIGIMALMQFAMFCITAIGFLFQGILVLFMPLLVPMALTKHFSHWFWGALDALVVFSMYRAVSTGVSFIWGSVIMDFFHNSVNGHYSLGTFLALLPTMWMLTLSFMVGVFMVPSVTSKLFGGAGQAGQAFASDVRAAVVYTLMA